MDVLKILVVDDEKHTRTAVVRALEIGRLRVTGGEPEGVAVTVLEADSGERALELIDAERPDIVFLDLMMPEMSGLEVLERLGTSRDLLAILVTAFASIETAVAATKRGAWDVLAKPFAPDEVRAVARKGAEHLLARRRAAALARERHQVRYKFVSEIAHELGNPLQLISGFLQLLEERTLGDDLDAYERSLKKMLDRAATMRKLIDDIHALTRLEAGEKARCFEEVDVEDVALAALENVAADAEARGIVVALHPSGGPHLRADPTDIECILNNLVSNAVKYNRDRGRVDVHISIADGVVTIRVVDTGIGIEPEDAPRVFDEFFRVRSPETDNVSGSGLGLSIVRRTTAFYGGSLSLESTPGVGTELTVSVPVQPEPVGP